MKKAVVIGAGQTGRGYVTRFLFQRDYAITFIDKNEKLIRMLDEDRAFCIHFYKKDRTPIYVNGFQAFHTYSKEADRAIQEADFIVTSTGEQNLGDVAQQVKAGMHNKQKKTVFLTAENGINPAKVLRTHLQEAGVEGDYTVTQTAVFCSTVSVHDIRLDILSMNEAYFPFDADELEELDFEGAVPIHNFEKFFKRKIYTYNCLAGLISYCGYIKGYEVYGDAACDPDIDAVMMRLMEELNPALQDYFQITKEDQEAFTNRALAKFRDKSILDYNIKNGRAPARKLGPTERIMSPMQILLDHDKDPRIMEFVAAAALVYWDELQGKTEPKMDKDLITTFCEINSLEGNEPVVEHVKQYLYEIKKNRDNICIMQILFG